MAYCSPLPMQHLLPLIRCVNTLVGSDESAEPGGSMKGSDENVATPGELYGHLGEILGKVRWGGKLFTIQKHGRPMARLVSAEKVQPGRDGKRRFPRGDYVQVTPGQFRS